MNIKILGNGGGFSQGLPYNSFVIDHTILIETPPDIVSSLYTCKVHPSEIEDIYISHFHGDHYFGFPFLSLHLCLSGSNKNINVYGPAGIKEKLTQLSFTAFGEENPLPGWIENHIRFIPVRENESILFDNGRTPYTADIFETAHYVETLGFLLDDDKKNRFCYLPDTSWDDKFKNILLKKPEIVLCDLNGEADDKVKVHMSEKDILKNGLSLSETTIFYGTHLRQTRKSTHPRIQYVSQGEEIIL
ncbi:MAG: ribonuclease Z [Spirochaetales bacterium]|nr:ribonuclease Z [Spirochaetales bacterium]